MKKKLFLIFLIFFTSINAQQLSDHQLDSLYNAFLNMRGYELGEDLHQLQLEIIKCGTVTAAQIKLNFERFSPEKQQLLKILLARPNKDTSMVSPSGFFRIHYNIDTSGIPAYDASLTIEQNVMQVAFALDSSYNFEVNHLGYPPPPQDNGEGGDNLYDVYISNLGNLYGFTQPETFIGNDITTSYIVIDDNYQGFFTTGLDGMRVTVAHELHHAIQVGNYTVQRFNQDGYFYEITSTAMEEFVYDDINDYYAYMPDYFNNPDRAFANNNGYNLAIWNIFLRDKFDYNILKRQWELLPQMRALDAISTSINEKGSTFRSMLNEFGVWTYFTKYRTITGKYFEEAANYPLIRSTNTIVFNSLPLDGEAKPTSNNFITFINVPDTIVTLISNSDIASGISNPNSSHSYEYTLTRDSLQGSVRLTDDYFAKLNVTQPILWSPAEILNNQVVRQDSSVFQIVTSDDIYAFPNPFYYGRNYSSDCNCIKIFMDSKGEPEADLNIYTSAMELVYSAKLPFDITGKILSWDIRNAADKKFATGVYLFAAKIGDEISKGKLVIFNE